ncbi:actin binding protein [Lipomyces oligophaga]|uniref:actin binding protein n=1 Tax=Lipomyces oligophaga TaxID=45792 RepID=UPI0034CF69E2
MKMDLRTQIEPQSEKDLRSDKDAPFQFGQRLLDDESSVWKHNAWDHVEWDEEQEKYAHDRITSQQENPADDFDKQLYTGHPARYWDKFYHNNEARFFKDRKWLRTEFPSVYDGATRPDSGVKVVMEVGCGAGNTMLPLLRNNDNPDLVVVGVDFSPRAVDIVNSAPEVDGVNARAEVWDLATADALPSGMQEHSVDYLFLVFVFSALNPSQWGKAVHNIARLMKPGGQILFRDYGRFDMAQLRFKKGRLLDNSFYARGDGTLVYFFTEQEIHAIFGKPPLKVQRLATDRRLLVNRKRQLKMYRVWLQAQFVCEDL